MITPLALVNGTRSSVENAALAITDAGVQRGDGAFETVGVWDGRPFRLDDHLARLDRSLTAIALPRAPDVVRADIAEVLEGQAGDGALRIFLTATGGRIVSLQPPPTRTPLRRLVSQPAPWIRPLGTYGPASAKTMSYGPNMAAGRSAQRAGGDDALLVSLESLVLEGPTFSVLWVRDGAVHAPDLSLGLVDSISRRTVAELAAKSGIAQHVGHYQLEDVLAADEVMTCSAVRPLSALETLDGHPLPTVTPVTDHLAAGLMAWRRAS